MYIALSPRRGTVCVGRSSFVAEYGMALTTLVYSRDSDCQYLRHGRGGRAGKHGSALIPGEVVLFYCDVPYIPNPGEEYVK